MLIFCNISHSHLKNLSFFNNNKKIQQCLSPIYLVMWRSNLMNLRVTYEAYSRKAWCALYQMFALHLICLVFFWFFCFSFFVGFCFFVFGLFVCLFPFSFYSVPPYYSHVEFIVIVWVCLTVFVNVSAFYFRNLLTASFHSEWEVFAIYGCTCMCVLVVSILFLYL